MLEARTFVKNFDKAKEILKSHNAIFKGEYFIHDVIYASKDPGKTLVDEFLRLRMIPKNIWEEKDFVVAIKNTELKSIGKNSIIPFRKEFDFEEEARKFIKENLLDRFQYSYEFDRTGWQYFIGQDGVDLEDIEGHFSIEIKSKTEEGLQKLAQLFDIRDPIKGPSVVAIKELLNK